MNASSLKLGFIGLGIMGAPMCGHLIAAGHQLFVNTVGKVPANIAETSATQCTTARGVAERADIIFIMVPDTPDVEKVLFGEDGVAAGLKGSSGKIVVDMSSISPVATKDFAKRIEAAGAQYLDAPSPAVKSVPRTAPCPSWSAAPMQPSSASSPCSTRWARTSPWWAATATARPPRWPTRSSWR
jgi:hypothetical protein